MVDSMRSPVGYGVLQARGNPNSVIRVGRKFVSLLQRFFLSNKAFAGDARMQGIWVGGPFMIHYSVGMSVEDIGLVTVSLKVPLGCWEEIRLPFSPRQVG